MWAGSKGFLVDMAKLSKWMVRGVIQTLVFSEDFKSWLLVGSSGLHFNPLHVQGASCKVQCSK
jgi:hypothetical protein